MATLTNTQISVTYVGLLKTSANTVLTSTAQQITDGSGNNSILYLSTAGVGIGGSPASGKELDVTGNVQVTGDLIVDNITIDGSTITNDSGNLTIVNTVNDGDVIFQSDDGSGGVATYFSLDGSQARNVASKDILFNTGVSAYFNSVSSGFRVVHDGSNALLINGTGNLRIQNGADDSDIIFECDDGSGGTTAYLTLDGSAEKILIQKSTVFTGGGMDYGVDGTGADVIFYGDTSGRNMKWDQSEDHLLFTDNTKLKFGTSSDLEIYHDSSNSYIDDAGTGNLKIRANNLQLQNISGASYINATSGGSVEINHNNSKKFETTSAGISVTGNVLLEGSAPFVEIKTTQTGTPDWKIYNSYNSVGDFAIVGGSSVSNKFNIQPNGNIGIGTTSPLQKLDTPNIIIGGTSISASYRANATLMDNLSGVARFYSLGSDNSTGGSYQFNSLSADGSAGSGTILTIANDGDATFVGDVKIQKTANTDTVLTLNANSSGLGSTYQWNLVGGNSATSYAFQIREGSTSYLSISNSAGGSGGDATFAGNVDLADSKKIQLGASQDLKLYHDGSHSYIQDSGTGVLKILSSGVTFQNEAGSSNTLVLDSSGNATFAGQISGIGGSAGAPSYIFEGNTDTGFFHPAVDAIGFSTAGSERMRITSAGLLGLGTTSPSHDIHVVGTGSVGMFESSDDSVPLRVKNTGSSVSTIGFMGTGSATEFDVRVGADSTNLVFYTGNSERMRIDSSGNVGIGIAPVSGARLTLGTGAVANEILSFASASGGNAELRNTSSTGSFTFTNSDGSSEKMRITSAGNVGIGTTSPAYKIDISGSLRATAESTFTSNLLFPDSARIKLGTGEDLQIYHNGTNSFITNETANLHIIQNVDDGDLIFESDNGSGSTTEYLRLDGGDVRIIATKEIRTLDGVAFKAGTSGDLEIYHDGTNSVINNTSGDLQIYNNVDDKDIVFLSDDGSGGTTEYIRLDGGATKMVASKDLHFADSVKAMFGNISGTSDLKIYHDGNNSVIADTGTGHLLLTTTTFRLRNNAQTEEIITADEDGAVELYYDGSKKFETTSTGVTVTGDLTISEKIIHSGDTNTFIQFPSSNDKIVFSTNGTDHLTLDATPNATFAGTVTLLDTKQLILGSANDFDIVHDGTETFISNSTGNLTIVNETNDGDVIFKSDDGSGGTAEYMKLDGSATSIIVSVTNGMYFNDSIKARFGTSGDMTVDHNGTDSEISNLTGDLIIRNNANDKDIRLQTDNGSGLVTDYILLDGSDLSTKILTQKVILSNLPTSDPNNAGQLYNESGFLRVSAG